MNKVRPMIFNAEMVQALLSGRKVITRRPVPDWQLPKLTCDGEDYMSIGMRHRRWGFGLFGKTPDEAMQQYNKGHSCLCPFGRAGDYLYVRESMSINVYLDMYYSADNECVDDEPEGWYYRNLEYVGGVPSIHMPRWASRLTLKISGVRVEKLKDITVEQALAEGFSTRMEFVKTWNSIYQNWKANPYVWVVEFEVINQNIDSYLSSSVVPV